MKISVHMLAFYPNRGVIRIADVPDNEFKAATSLIDKLELVFKYGQNDFQRQDKYSVSMGDVVEHDKKFYLVAACGFKEISKDVFDKIVPPSHLNLGDIDKLATPIKEVAEVKETKETPLSKVAKVSKRRRKKRI